MLHSETLLLINDKKADVSEANIRRYQAMGGNNDVDTAIGQSDEHSLLLSGGAKSAEELYGDRILTHAFSQRLIVLLRKHRCGCHQSSLLSIHDRLEHCANGYFSLSEPDIAADKAVHGALRFHVLLGLDNGTKLIRGFLKRKSILELLLPVRVRSE